MLDSLKVVNKQLGSYGCSDHYDLGFNYGKKKHLCNYSAFLSLCCLPATHSLSYWNTLSCITAAIIGCTYMYGFSSKLHLKRFFFFYAGISRVYMYTQEISDTLNRLVLNHRQPGLVVVVEWASRKINKWLSCIPWWWTKWNQSTQRVTCNLGLTCRICKYFVDAEGLFS